MVQVLDGLKEGDVVVVAGQQRLRGDEVPVRVVDLNRAPGSGQKPSAAGKDGGPAKRPADAPAPNAG
jgi:hypothetical protein